MTFTTDNNIKAIPLQKSDCRKCIVNKVRIEKNIDFAEFCAAMGFEIPKNTKQFFKKVPVRRIMSLKKKSRKSNKLQEAETQKAQLRFEMLRKVSENARDSP